MKPFGHSFFQNQTCKFFPCHTVDNEDEFNCLFCYCPLYMLGDQCGGNFVYNEQGLKSCVLCTLPHCTGGYEYILSKFPEISDLAKRREPKE